MFNLFCAIFFGIGLSISIIALCYGVTNLTETVQKAAKDRTERMRRILAALERIEENTRNKPNQG